MKNVQKYIIGTCMVASMAVAMPAAGETILFASGQGLAKWTSDNAAVCAQVDPEEAPCSGTTVEIGSLHDVWQPNDPSDSGAVWVSYADTGINGLLAPHPTQEGDSWLLMTIKLELDAVSDSKINLTVWADDTAAIWFNGEKKWDAITGQDYCANAQIGCQPNESKSFEWDAKGKDVIQIQVHQVGTGITAASNPFGVLYYGSYERDLDPGTLGNVPEPASMALLGLGLLGAGVARRRKR